MNVVRITEPAPEYVLVQEAIEDVVHVWEPVQETVRVTSPQTPLSAS
jgi:hypothetical protein